jgi:hypothetical protein
MCKYVVLQYTQCNCHIRESNEGNGFIVTREWYNRLTVDHDTVPIERCTQAKCFELSPNQLHTVEFPRCKNVQVKTIRVAGQVCFACLMHRRSMDRAAHCRTLEVEYRKLQEKMRTAFGERQSFQTCYTGAIKSATLRAAPASKLWQSIRESPQLGEKAKDKGGCFVDTLRDLRTTRLKSTEPGSASWEEILEKQIAHREAKKERKSGKGPAGVPNGKMKEESTAKQDRVSAVKKFLVSLNKAQVPQEPAQTESVASVPPVCEKPETSSPVVQDPPPRLRLGPKKTAGTGALPDSMSTSWKGAQQEDNIEAIDGSSSGIPLAFSTLPRATKPISRYSDPTLTVTPSHGANAPSSPQMHSTLSAKAAEFKPFVQPPPTEPRMMRAPTAPRALRETQTVLEPSYGSFPQTIWGPWQFDGASHGYALEPEWRE